MRWLSHKFVRLLITMVFAVATIVVTVLWGWQEHEQRSIEAVQTELDEHAKSLVLGIVRQDDETVAAVKALSSNNSFAEAIRSGNEEFLLSWTQAFVDVGGISGVGIQRSNPDGFWATGVLSSDARALLDDPRISEKHGYTNGELLLTSYQDTVMLTISDGFAEMVGSVVVEADLNSRVPLIRSQDGSQITVVRSDGVILTSGTIDSFSQTRLSEKVREMIVSQRPSSFTYENEKGEQMLASFRPVPAREYGVLIEISYKNVFSEKGTYWYSLGGCALILLIIGAWLGNISRKTE